MLYNNFNDELASPMMSSSGFKLRNSLCRRVNGTLCSCFTTATTISVGWHVQRASTYKDI